jgi:hypothetical protein
MRFLMLGLAVFFAQPASSGTLDPVVPDSPGFGTPCAPAACEIVGPADWWNLGQQQSYSLESGASFLFSGMRIEALHEAAVSGSGPNPLSGINDPSAEDVAEYRRWRVEGGSAQNILVNVAGMLDGSLAFS